MKIQNLGLPWPLPRRAARRAERLREAIRRADWAEAAALVKAYPLLANDPAFDPAARMSLFQAALADQPYALALFSALPATIPELEATLGQRTVEHFCVLEALEKAAQFIDTLPGPLRGLERVALLRSLAALNAAPLEAGLVTTPSLALDRLHGFPDLAELWFQLARDRLGQMDRRLRETQAFPSPAERQRVVDAALGPAAALCLLHARGGGQIRDRITALLRSQLANPATLVVSAILALPRQGAAEVKAHSFAALTAFRYNGAIAPFEAAFLPDQALELHPVILRAAMANGELLTSPELVRLAGPLSPATREVLQRKALDASDADAHVSRMVLARDARRQGPGRPGPLHALPGTAGAGAGAAAGAHTTPGARAKKGPARVFVGVFGQLRFAAYTLPALVRFIRQDFDDDGEFDLSFALATWNQEGQRELRDEDIASFALDRLPDEVARLLARLLGRELPGDVRGLRQRLPATIDALMRSSRSSKQITESHVAEAFGWPGAVDLEDAETFTAVQEPRVTAVFGPGSGALNQIRMWDRIAALGRQAREAEAVQGARFDAVLLIRSDLELKSGSLAALTRALLDRGLANTAMVDHDGWAAFIDGLGDRFLLMDRAASMRVFDGGPILERMLQDAELVAHEYRRDMGGHVFLGSLLFEHGTDVLQIFRDKIDFEIYRGGNSIEDLRAHLAADAETTADPELAASLCNLLGATAA